MNIKQIKVKPPKCNRIPLKRRITYLVGEVDYKGSVM